MPHKLTSVAEFQQAIQSEQLVVIDFFATWCGPCVMIAPIFEQLATANPDVHFYKVDVDEADDICSDQNIESMPTFIFAKNGKILTKMSGANEHNLRNLIAELK